uniref:lysozyme-like protein 6 isoform X2 n=1 Tax=Halichoerus grypus TaxID=9711 RepID=UPI0016597DEB|nr:lysozyme-like protein 6 isoform X2 [Halichoerus grypus]
MQNQDRISFNHHDSLIKFLRHSEKTSGTSGRASEPRTLDSTFSPPKMMGTLLMSLVSCLIAISQASLIDRCDLARVLYKEDLDGFEGYSLADCPLKAASTFDPARCPALGFAQFPAHTRHPLKTLFSLFKGLCLAFVESKFNISKVNENADGSFDYGIFQINSHYRCNDYRSHSEDICHEDCQDLLSPISSQSSAVQKRLCPERGG